MGVMDARQAVLGGVLGLASVIELASRLAGTSTVRAGPAARVLAVGMAVPFLVLAVALAADPRSAPVVGTVTGLAGAGGETRVLAVLLASAIPVAAQAVVAAYESGLVVPGTGEPHS